MILTVDGKEIAAIGEPPPSSTRRKKAWCSRSPATGEMKWKRKEAKK